MNSKGLSVLFLLVAMLLMVAIGYVFSYLIPSKQKSLIFPVQSTQAFFIAGSGVEFAVRYATDHNWKSAALLDANLNNLTRNLGNGSFRLLFNYATYGNTLISVGEVPSGTEKRRIRLSNFSDFVKPLVLTPPDPCLNISRTWFLIWWYRHEASFYIRNVSSTSIVLNAFRATWTADPPAITVVMLGGTQRWTGTYNNGAAPAAFSSTHTIASGNTVQVQIRWWNWAWAQYNFSNLVIYFYDTNGNEHSFRLDREGDGLPTC
jgi:hypothetical protein